MSRIKICGLTRPEDIESVNCALPDYVGFVFAPSRRRVDIKTAKYLKSLLDPRITAVGVFVNQDPGLIADLIAAGVVDIAQLHGEEDGAYILDLKKRCGRPVIKTFGIGEPQGLTVNLTSLHARPARPTSLNASTASPADYVLFDTLSMQRGGSGATFDWRLLLDYSGPPYFLAGGLTAENIPEALSLLNPFCIDVSSGAETNGLKDRAKINAIVSLARRSIR